MCVWAIRSGTWRVSSAGSVPPISRCPVSRHSKIAGAVEHLLHVVGALDHGPDVRMQHGRDPAVRGERGEPVQVAQQRRPALVVQDRARVVAGQAAVGGQDERRRAGRDEPVEHPVDGGCRVVPGDVQHHRHEPADGVQVVLGEGVGELRRIRGEEAVGADLGGRETDLAHLGEHSLGRELVPPAGDLADTPGNGRSGDPLFRMTCHRFSSRTCAGHSSPGDRGAEPPGRRGPRQAEWDRTAKVATRAGEGGDSREALSRPRP